MREMKFSEKEEKDEQKGREQRPSKGQMPQSYVIKSALGIIRD